MRGVDALLADAGVHDPSVSMPDLSRAQVAAEIGGDPAALAQAGDRGAAVHAMAEAAASAGAAAAPRGPDRRRAAVPAARAARRSPRAAMRALPVGVAEADGLDGGRRATRPLRRRVTDVTMMSSVDDSPASTRSRARILTNAAAAIAGMVQAPPVESRGGRAADRRDDVRRHHAVRDRARERLEARGYEVLVFHATGTGGRAMEALMRAGFIAGVLDVTTTELVRRAGRRRARRPGPTGWRPPGERGLPQVVSLGALDMVNFGARDTVPARFRRPQPLRAQPDGHADADDAARSARSSAADRAAS